jgi:hypothetical protein
VHLTRKFLHGSETSKIGQVIHTVKYTDDLVLLAKEEEVLQDMTERLSENEKCYRMDTNVEKPKVMRNSRQPPPVQIMLVNNSQRMWNISTILVV